MKGDIDMTEEQRAQAAETRARNKAARDKRFRERLEDEKTDRPATLEALRKIRDDDRSTPGQRLFAILTIDEMQSYHHIPSRLKYSQDDSVLDNLRVRFAEELKAAENNT